MYLVISKLKHLMLYLILWSYAGLGQLLQEISSVCVFMGVKSLPYLSSLRYKLWGIEFGYNAFQDFIDYGRKDTLIIVLPQMLVHIGKFGGHGPWQHTQRNVHHLKVWAHRKTSSMKTKYVLNWYKVDIQREENK